MRAGRRWTSFACAGLVPACAAVEARPAPNRKLRYLDRSEADAVARVALSIRTGTSEPSSRIGCQRFFRPDQSESEHHGGGGYESVLPPTRKLEYGRDRVVDDSQNREHSRDRVL